MTVAEALALLLVSCAPVCAQMHLSWYDGGDKPGWRGLIQIPSAGYAAKATARALEVLEALAPAPGFIVATSWPDRVVVTYCGGTVETATARRRAAANTRAR